MNVEITLCIIRKQILFCTRQLEIFLQAKLCNLLFERISLGSLSQYIPSRLIAIFADLFHGRNCDVICFLIGQSSDS